MAFIIHRKPPYRVYVEERGGKASAHVAELPGCFAEASTAPRAAAATPQAIIDFLAWLRAHGEPLVPEAYVSRPTMADLYVSQVSRGPGSAEVSDLDTAPWSEEKFERTIRSLHYSRADLLSLVGDATDEELRSRRSPSGGTVLDVLKHIADTERAYIEAATGPLEIPPDDVTRIKDYLDCVRDALYRRASEMPAESRSAPVFSPGTLEQWTLTKLLRRALEHELQHSKQLGPR